MYYSSSKAASKAIAMKDGDRFMPFEQMDLKYNRPDIVAERLGYADEKLIESYEFAYKKRLKRLGFTEDQLTGDIQLPELSINYEGIPLATQEKELTFQIKVDADIYTVDRINVYINNVPVFGMNGLDVSEKKEHILTRDITVELSAGMNTIKTSAMNNTGFESMSQVFNSRIL